MYVKARYTHILSHPFQFTIHLLQSLSPTDAHSKGHVPSHCAVRAWSRSRWLIVSKLSWRGNLQLALLGFWILSINPPLIHSAVLLTLTAVCSKSAFCLLSYFILLFGRHCRRNLGGGFVRPRVWPDQNSLCYRVWRTDFDSSYSPSIYNTWSSYSAANINDNCTAQHSKVQYSTVQYSTVQYSTVQYSTVQYSTVQYSTV
jgi:hypothetical protein